MTATYTSPGSPPQTLSTSLDPATSTASTTTATASSTGIRVAHLAQLQTGLRTLQADVNALLTQKMAHDKAADDAREEETYGEEEGA